MDRLRDLLDGKIDYQGQRLADRINQEVVVLGALLALFLGWLVQSLSLTMYVYGGVVAVALVACLPPWPMYRRHPEQWLPNRPSSAENDAPETEKKTQ